MAGKIYTKTGDDGTTGLFGGKRVSKADIRVNLYGTIDELNSIIGLITTKSIPAEIIDTVTHLNNLLFIAGGDAATPIVPPPKFNIERIDNDDIILLESLIDEYTTKLPVLKNFILPGGTEVAALFHLARTVCRRAERIAVELADSEELGKHLIVFLNRLSDYLFTAARYSNFLESKDDVIWSGR